MINVAMASNLLASDGLQPNSNGLQRETLQFNTFAPGMFVVWKYDSWSSHVDTSTQPDYVARNRNALSMLLQIMPA